MILFLLRFKALKRIFREFGMKLILSDYVESDSFFKPRINVILQYRVHEICQQLKTIIPSIVKIILWTGIKILSCIIVNPVIPFFNHNILWKEKKFLIYNSKEILTPILTHPHPKSQELNCIQYERVRKFWIERGRLAQYNGRSGWESLQFKTFLDV